MGTLILRQLTRDGVARFTAITALAAVVAIAIAVALSIGQPVLAENVGATVGPAVVPFDAFRCNLGSCSLPLPPIQLLR